MNYLNISREDIPPLKNELNVLLANLQLHRQKMLNFHWNIKGEDFYELHEVFEQHYRKTAEWIDEVAERIQILKGRPLSLLSQYLETAEIKEKSSFRVPREMMKETLSDKRILIENMYRLLTYSRKAGDEGTTHMIGEMLVAIEQQSWMLDSWLAKPVNISVKPPVEEVEA